MTYEFEMNDGVLVKGYIHDNVEGVECLTIPGYIKAQPILKKAIDKYGCVWVYVANSECYIGLP